MNSNKCLIIAEAGVNHNGDLDLACRMVDAAAECGADVVKFQAFTAGGLVTRWAGKAVYQERNTGNAESQYEMLCRLELGRDAHQVLMRRCAQRNIGYLVTPFDIESIDMLERLGVARYKIPSGEITNLPYLRHIGRVGKPIILSTGMADIDEVRAALSILEESGTPKDRVIVLHCNTEYPTPYHDVNLLAMVAMRNALGVETGYSDHTQGIEVAIAAVALGAAVIEKHFTMDRSLPGPDHKASIEPAELRAMVKAVRNAESALGDGVKRQTESEAKNRPVARKSIVAGIKIPKGTLFNSQNLAVKRPGTGISPMRWDEVIGRTASRDFDVDELIEL